MKSIKSTKRTYHTIIALGVFAMLINSVVGFVYKWSLLFNFIFFYVISFYGNKLWYIDNLHTDKRGSANK